MPNVFLKVDKDLFKLKLNPTEILVLAQITEFNTNTGDCFMSDKMFAEMFGVSDKTISRALTNLESKGLIKRETKNVRNGKERHIRLTNGQNVPCKTEAKELPTDKMSLVQQTNCPMHNRQNDSIKDNKKINIKDNNEALLANANKSSEIPVAKKKETYEKVERSFLDSRGCQYVELGNNIIQVIATGKRFELI